VPDKELRHQRLQLPSHFDLFSHDPFSLEDSDCNVCANLENGRPSRNSKTQLFLEKEIRLSSRP